jgi:hypothetical protein
MKKSYLDEFGFFAGEIDTDYTFPDFSATLIDPPPPPVEVPIKFNSWFWNGDEWVLKEDNRGRYWYLESDTDIEYIGKTPTDVPPAGYVEFVNGVGKVMLPAERLQKVTDKNRIKRNKLLIESDWTDTASAPFRLGEVLYQQWQTYRQALRDITTQADPFNIVWPVPPGG